MAALVLYQLCGSPERGVGLPLVRSGGGRAVPDTGYNADMTYLVL
jgi:hypothetical protein